MTFDIIDNGKAMNDVELGRLFQRFAQANTKTHVETGGGSGLGLHICSTLVKLLGGEISASRNELDGTTFTFSVLTRRVALPPSSTVTTNATKLSAGGAAHNGARSGEDAIRALHAPNDFEGVILLVEDNLVNQKLVKKQLTMAGYQVDVANNGLEALEYFEGPQGDGVRLCLCDIDMPFMDGYETVRRVKELYKQRAAAVTGPSGGVAKVCPPFVAVSANARTEQIERQISAGHDETLSKPFSTVELLEMVSRMIQTHASAAVPEIVQHVPTDGVLASPTTTTATWERKADDDRFDREAREWDANLDMQLINAESAKALLPLLKSLGARRILELGSGTGLMPFSAVHSTNGSAAGDGQGRKLYEEFEHWLGVDTSVEMCRVMSEKIAAAQTSSVSDKSDKIEVRNLFLTGPQDLAEGGDYFDYCVSTVTFHHVADMGALLKTLHATVARGVAVVDYEFWPGSRSFHPEDKMEGVEHHGLVADDLVNLCRQAGFVRVDVHRPFEVTLRREGRDIVYPFLVVVAHKDV